MAWAALIFHLSSALFSRSFTAWLLFQTLSFLHLSVSPGTFDLLHFLVRKLAHLTEYAIFSQLLYASFLGTDEFEWRPGTALWSILIAAAYSLSDEFHQLFEPGRTGSIIDSGIDTVGAVLGMLAIYAATRFRQASNRRTAAEVGNSKLATRNSKFEIRNS